jgi:hypothetical protein
VVQPGRLERAGRPICVAANELRELIRWVAVRLGEQEVAPAGERSEKKDHANDAGGGPSVVALVGEASAPGAARRGRRKSRRRKEAAR